MNNQIQSFITAKLNQTPQLVRDWYHYDNNPDKLKLLSKESLADDIERIDSDDLANAYCQFVCEGGVSVNNYERYKTQIITLPELGEALCGIRFRGMELSKPFINVAITTKPLNIASIAKAVTLIKDRFADFSPKYIRFYISVDENGDMPITHNDFQQYDLTTKWDKILVANQFSQLTSFPTSSTIQEKYLLELANNLDFYDDYTQTYADLFSQKPEFKQYTRCENREDLQSILDNKGFHFVLYERVNGRQIFAGLFTLEWACFNGLEGLYVIEKFIRNDLHGQGLGKQFESWAMANLLEQNLVSADTVLFGEIDFDNKASLHNAYTNGRVDVGKYLWVTC